jgi:hypothetical protein
MHSISHLEVPEDGVRCAHQILKKLRETNSSFDTAKTARHHVAVSPWLDRGLPQSRQ